MFQVFTNMYASRGWKQSTIYQRNTIYEALEQDASAALPAFHAFT